MTLKGSAIVVNVIRQKCWQSQRWMKVKKSKIPDDCDWLGEEATCRKWGSGMYSRITASLSHLFISCPKTTWTGIMNGDAKRLGWGKELSPVEGRGSLKVFRSACSFGLWLYSVSPFLLFFLLFAWGKDLDLLLRIVEQNNIPAPLSPFQLDTGEERSLMCLDKNMFHADEYKFKP